MSFLRILRIGTNCIPRRYLPVFLLGVAVAILLSQGFLAYILYGIPDSSGYAYGSLRVESGPNIDLRTQNEIEAWQQRPTKEGSATDLAFKPNCTITNADVLSALRRAKTSECKEEITNIHCKDLRRELYPTRLNSTCPLHGASAKLGCFKTVNLEALHSPHYIMNNSLKNQSPVIYSDRNSCINACLTIGSPFAMYTASLKRCFCSNASLDEWNKDVNCIECSDCDQVFKTGLPTDAPKNVANTRTQASTKRARIVFLLTVNGRSVRQVRRLITALRNTSKINHYFYVHVDERQDYLYRSLKELEDPSWLAVGSRRFSTIWGGASLLQMLLSCLGTLIRMTHWQWDYVINLSETDFPLKRVELLEQFLYLNLGQNFVRPHGPETARFIAKQALRKTFHQCENRMWKLGDRDLPTGIHFDGGSDWVSLHRDFVDWLITNRDSDPLLKGLESVYRQTLLPAESYFHTVLQNSYFCTKIIENNLRFVNWRRKQGCKCQYKHIVDWCGCSPNVFLEDDEEKLTSLQLKPIFFGRKFEPVISQSTLNFVEGQIGIKPKTSTHTESLSSFWQNEYHHLDRSPPVDQGRLSAWTSLARLAVEHLANQGSHCVLRAVRVLEAWLYFKEDNFEGLVINFEAHAEHIPEPVRSEAIFRRVDPFKRSDRFQNDRFADRLRGLEVSTEFDLKELLSRNFAGIIGPYSEPGVVQEWDAGPAGSVTFVWIDPAKVVAGSYEIHVTRNEQIQNHKPPLRKPLRPGNWQLKVFKDWVLMAETSFLVQPQTFHHNLPLKNESVSEIVNGGPDHGYTDTDLSTVERYLGFRKSDILDSIKEAESKSKWTSVKLEKWSDALTWPRWTLEGLCFVANPLHQTGGVFCPRLPLESCVYMPWSSERPDEKSNI
ncbi:xylosyltransferase oxt [Galendromus occidentalis]|uniref:protein xylosyltransferase n=1 Tax=Galendromus occidentalis TaxID=34638 RepID=A0AAJ6QPQ0_9ACAR|nr:xylosyltransferase oxt [Galendromus occidentalis]